jgi:hypothetical protein
MKFDKFSMKHAGERCFILGSAPSLREENLALLEGETVFSCNKSFLAKKDLNLPNYSYFVLTDSNVHTDIYTNNKEDFDSINVPRFYSSQLIKHKKDYVKMTEDYVIIDKMKHYPISSPKATFPNSFKEGWGLTGTVVYEATLTAFFMGFKEIYLLGVDMDYSNKQDTHFYKMGLREKGDAYTMEKWWSRIEDSAKFIKRGLYNNNVKWENLSKGFKHHNMIPKNTLENVI